MRAAGKKVYHAPTGILTGPLDDNRRRLIQPAVVLINLDRGGRLAGVTPQVACMRLTFLEEYRSEPLAHRGGL